MARILSGTSWGCCSTDIFPKSSPITATVAVTGFGGFSKSVTYTTPYFGGTGYNNNTNTLAVKDASSNLVARAGLTYWGGLDSISYGSSGGTSVFGYDTYLHLNSIDSPGTLCDGSYTYDRTGNVTTRDGTSYTYDGMNRLLNGAGTTYGYDEIGNITASTGTDPASFTYASTGGLDSMLMRSITRSGTQSVSDDAKRGWITGIDTRYSNLKWDVFGRLEAIVDLARGQSGTQQDIYRYYPDGLRYRKDETAMTGAVTTSLYLYEGNDILLKEMLEGTTWKTAQVNVRLGGLEIGRYVKDYVGGTERLEYVWLDTLGSRRAVADTSGSIKAKIDYSVWGTPTVTNYNGYDGSLDVSYTGKERDATGLSYFNARYYDPLAGRFYSEDPIRDGMNWFVYCGNNPLSSTDSTGLDVGSPGMDATTHYNEIVESGEPIPGYEDPFEMKGLVGVSSEVVKMYSLNALQQALLGRYGVAIQIVAGCLAITGDRIVSNADMVRWIWSNLPDGNNPKISKVAATVQELQKVYELMIRGGTQVPTGSMDGTMIRLPDGTLVKWRNTSSARSGGTETIEIEFPNGTVKKVHIR
jgi:RHS repeat-associated protein